MRASRFRVPAILACAIAILLTTWPGDDSEQLGETQQIEVQVAVNRTVSDQSTERPQATTTSANQQLNCIHWSMIGQNADAYVIDEWYSTWGAPPSFNPDLASRPYSNYAREELEALAESGDPAAIHELGRNIVWSAFRDEERLPDMETLWELGGQEYPYSARINSNLLKQGRDLLYKAAVSGRLYALIEISLSYAHQHAIENKAGGLNATDLNSLQVEAYAYGESVERLIVGMPSSFFQARAPQGLDELAEARLSEVVRSIMADRTAKGLNPAALPQVSDGLLELLNLCAN